jgi:hypothetical protein
LLGSVDGVQRIDLLGDGHLDGDGHDQCDDERGEPRQGREKVTGRPPYEMNRVGAVESGATGIRTLMRGVRFWLSR